jgi:hypothetical protein
MVANCNMNVPVFIKIDLFHSHRHENVLQGRDRPSLLYGLLLHRRMGYRTQHPTAGCPVPWLPPPADRALPNHQLHERVLHVQEHVGHSFAALQVSYIGAI